MAKDGVVSIAIDYKDELNQMIRDYESALTEMASSDKLSKGMKAQFDNTIAELKRFKADMEKAFSDLSIGKVDKNSFKAFKQTVNKNFESVRAEIDNLNLAVSTINSQIKILGNGIDISKISSQFKDFEDYVQNTNNAIDTMIKKLNGQGISLMSFDDSAVNQAKSQIKEINKLLKSTDEFSDAKGSKYELFDTDQAQAELDVLARDLKNTLELIEKSESELSNFDKNSIGFEKTINQINILKLKAADLHDSIQQLMDIPDKTGEYTFGDSILISDDNVDKKVSEYEKIVKGTLDEIRESAIKTREELEKIVTPISSKTASAKISDKLNPNSAELVTGITIETTSSELWKKLSPIIEDLQNILNKNPVVAPVKLVVAPNAVSSEKNDEVGTISKSYSKKYQRELAKTGEDAVIDLEGVYKKTFTSIMDEAVSYSKETISKIQNIFESSPIKLYFDFNEEEFKKLSNVLLSSDSGKKIDITGQIAESKKEVNELAEKLAEVNELLNSADSKDFSFKGFDKFAEEISKNLGQLTELQSMLKTLQNIESVLARASGVSSVTDIETQWQNVSKLIENSIKLDGTFRKNANINKLATEYNKYLNMGGTNELSSIGKIGKFEDSKNIIDTILSKVKELNSQKVDTSSVDKADDELKSVSSTLDDVISRLDHMINLTRDIGNTFWKMFKDASVSDVDKQWSSIESKFKSIADESGKINLSKQKKDIQELVEMYQKYVNAGGMNTPFDLTDNAETIKKMNKVYEQINSKKDGTSVTNETKSFTKVEDSVNSLTSAINTKTEAIKTEANTMELAARAEIKSIQKIIEALNQLIEKIENIPELKIPKEDTTIPSKESNISLTSDSTVKQQIKSESELNAEIEKRENIIRELQQLQEKLTVHEDFHDNDRYFADQLPTEEEIREADKRIKQLTGTNNIFDVDKLIQDRNEWLSEVKYSLEEYDDLIKANDQKALDEYTTRGLSRIGGAESFFGYEDNNFSIASKFVEEKEKIQNEINDLYTDLDKLDEKMNLDSNNSSVDNIVQSQEKLQSELKETQKQAEKTTQAVKEVSSTASQDQTKDAFPNANADTKLETEGMKQVEEATHDAVQAKKDFATANEGVQSSIDGSENPLKLEAELMEQIAKSAREAADAKKEFVEANKQVKDSADGSNSKNKQKDKYAKRSKISEDDFLNNSNKYSSIANEKLSNSGYTILGGTVNSDLINGLVKVTAKIKDIDGNWKTFSARIDADGNMFSQRFRTITKGVNNLDNELANFGKDKIKTPETDEQVQKFKELNTAIDDYASVRKRIENGKAFKKDEEDSQNLLKLINEIMGKADGSATILSPKQLSDAQDKLDKIDKTISEIQQKNVQKVGDSLLKIQGNGTEKLSKYTDSSKYTPEFIERVNSKIGEIGQLDITKPEDVTRLKAIDGEIQKIVDDSKLLENKLVKQDSKIADIISQMKIFRSQNTNMSSSQKQNLDSVIKYAEELKNAGKVTAQEIEKIKISFSGLKAEVASTGNMGKNFFSQIGSRLTDMNSKFVAQFLSWQDWIRYIQQGINTVRELDTALTEMRKVSDESLQSLKNYQNTTFDVADAVGTTAKQIQTSTADYMRLGESLDEAAESAKTANVLLNVSEFDNIEDATKSLVAMGQAYKDLDKMTIVDKLNEVGNNYAISTDELATALQKSSATLSLMGNTIDEAASLVTTANATIQDADSVSAGLRTISLRLVGTEEAEEELSAMNEEVDAFVKATNSKKQQIIKDYTAVASNNYQGFDILDSNGNYKNTYEILLGIAKVYKEIQEQDKKLGTNHATALIEELAGKNRSNIASAILQDPTQLEAVKKSSEEALGSAENELNSYLDSIDGKMAQLENRAQEFWFKVIDSETIKNGIDLLSTLLKGTTDFVDTVGLLPTILTGIGAALSFKNVGRDKMYSLSF